MNRLAHARASWVLTSAGIQHLVFKGVSTALLVDPSRLSGDVDILVAPADFEAAVTAFKDAGFVDIIEGGSPIEGATHARTLVSRGCTVDLHRHFPGLENEPNKTWRLLWVESEPLLCGGAAIRIPGLTGRLLLLAINAARDGVGSRAARDLAVGLPRVATTSLRDLAVGLGALGPLKAGLSTLEDGADAWVRTLRLDEVVVPDRWKVLAEGASGPDRKWQELRDASWAQRLRILWRELWPTRAFIAFLDSRAATSRRIELLTRWRRWMRLAREVPRSARRVRRRTTR